MQHFISGRKIFVQNQFESRIKRKNAPSIHDSLTFHQELLSALLIGKFLNFFVIFPWKVMYCDKQWLLLWNIMVGRDEKSIHIDFKQNLKGYSSFFKKKSRNSLLWVTQAQYPGPEAYQIKNEYAQRRRLRRINSLPKVKFSRLERLYSTQKLKRAFQKYKL